MNCQELRAQLDDYLAGELSPTITDEAGRHLSGCADCQRRLAGLQALRAALRSQEVPAARSGFFEMAMQNARHSHGAATRVWARVAGVAIAAGLAVWIAFGGMFLPFKGADRSIPGITLALHQTHTIKLSFNAERELTGASLRIHLPDGVEIRGFPGKRDIEWRTDLARGVNMLSLPVKAVAMADGSLTAQLRHGDRTTELSLRILVSRTGQAADVRS